MKTYVDAAKLQEYTTKLVAKLKTIFPGTPLTASTVAGMTDTTRVYVYTGSETGYTAGNWYYWDGTAWTSGGIYQSSGIETDTTLSVAGKAADGKATGDAIAAAKAAVLAEIAPAYSTSGTYAVGDYVIYNSGLYRCVSAISTAESWTAAHWVSVDLAPDLGGQVSALKTHFNFYDMGFAGNCPTGTHEANDVTFTWNGNQCTVSGTASADAIERIFYNVSSFPDNIYPGKDYYVSFENETNGVNFHIIFYKDGAEYGGVRRIYESTKISIPSDANGMQIRLQVPDDTTASGTFTYYGLHGTEPVNDIVDNIELPSKIEWEFGALKLNDGGRTDPTVANTRLRTKLYLPTSITHIETVGDYEFSVYAYNKQTGTYIGNYRSKDSIITSTTVWNTYLNIVSDYLYKIVLRHKSNTSDTLTVSDASNCLVINKTVNDNKVRIEQLENNNLVDLVTKYGNISGTYTDRTVVFTWNDGVCSVVGTADGANAILRVMPRYKCPVLSSGNKILVKVATSDSNIQFRIHEYITISGETTENDVYFDQDAEYVIPDNLTDWTFAIISKKSQAVNGTIKVNIYAGLPENLYVPLVNYSIHPSWWVFAGLGRTDGEAVDASVENSRLCTNRFISDNTKEIHVSGHFEVA